MSTEPQKFSLEEALEATKKAFPDGFNLSWSNETDTWQADGELPSRFVKNSVGEEVLAGCCSSMYRIADTPLEALLDLMSGEGKGDGHHHK